MLNLLLSKEDPVNLHVLGVANKIARSLTKGHFLWNCFMVQRNAIVFFTFLVVDGLCASVKLF